MAVVLRVLYPAIYRLLKPLIWAKAVFEAEQEAR